jgi:hypothetical protein
MQIEDRVRATLAARADAVQKRGPDVGSITPLSRNQALTSAPVVRRMPRRGVTIVTAFAVSVAAGLLAWSAFRQTPSEVTGASPAASSDAQSACQSWPWADVCPEADWVREVLRNAGVAAVGDTGSAIVGRTGGEFYVWATSVEEERPLSRIVSGEAYELAQRVDGTPVYSDGVRFLWRVDRLYVWVQSGEEAFTISPGLIETLVLSTHRIAIP